MGRPGTGSGGGHSTGGHSVGRSSGGHRIGNSGSHRPGIGSSTGGFTSFSGSHVSANRNRGSSGSDFGSIMMGMALADSLMKKSKSKLRNEKPYINSGRTNHTRSQVHRTSYSDFDSVSNERHRNPDLDYYSERHNQNGGSGGRSDNNSNKDSNKDPFGVLFKACLIIFAFVVFISCIVMTSGTSKRSGLVSTKNRTKLEHPVPYDNNNVVDELGYLDDKSKLSRDLQNFYDVTGILPYVVLKSYDKSLISDESKTAYAEQYYDDHIKNEGSMLYMYFEDANPDEVGYMSYVNGTAVKSVMDAEAIDIFWSYLDTYWVDENLSMDDVFVKTFDKTAETIMTKSRTKEDVAFVKYIVLIIVIVGGLTVIMSLIWFKHKREKAAETERILGTPLDHSDELLDKYSGDE